MPHSLTPLPGRVPTSVTRRVSEEQGLAYRDTMWSLRRRIRANLIYLKQPFRTFLPLLCVVAILVLIGAFAFHELYRHPEVNDGGPIKFTRALHVTWALVFMEHLLPWPDPEHWLLDAFYLLMPPIGLVVILDGFVRFGYHIFRRDESGREWLNAVTKTFNDHIIVCGLGKTGIRILQKLVGLGEKVVVLEKNAQCENLAWARRHGIPVRVGSGREEGIWEDLNTANAKSIVLATDDDLANLEMALDARKVKPGIRVVLRMYDQELAEKIRDSFDIHLAFSTAELAAPLFATSSSDRSIVNAFYVGERLLVVARIVVNPGSELIDTTVGEISGTHQAFVLTHRCEGRPTLHPSHDTTIRMGDRLTIQCEPEQLRSIHKRNKDPQPVV